MLVCVYYSTIARETAGAARTRSSLRPLILRRDNEMQNFGRIAPREGEVAFNRHCERSEAIHLAARRENGLLRCARNDVDRPILDMSFVARTFRYPVTPIRRTKND
jgi:hypothetical protein